MPFVVYCLLFVACCLLFVVVGCWLLSVGCSRLLVVDFVRHVLFVICSVFCVI